MKKANKKPAEIGGIKYNKFIQVKSLTEKHQRILELETAVYNIYMGAALNYSKSFEESLNLTPESADKLYDVMRELETAASDVQSQIIKLLKP